MKKFIFFWLFSLSMITCFAQDPAQMHETAKAFMRQGDYANAVLVLTRARQADPTDIPIAKDLALCYYFQKEFQQSLSILKPLVEKNVDDQVYQLAGNAHKALEQYKDCEKLYRKGIKKFPGSGALYNELGELLWGRKDYTAIKIWERGIQMDPSYSRNYYNAARYYFLTTDKVWSLLYGEIFVNMEPQSLQSPEMKDMLLAGYKKLFSENSIASLAANEKNQFAKAFLESMSRQNELAADGIGLESLMMIRTRFILHWSHEFKSKFPFRLFELQQQLLQEGMAEAYHRWLFGSSLNLVNYQQWIQAHPQEYQVFMNFQKTRLFKIPSGQYYH
ncbi:MAG: tetratricopeptide repeat protein [Ferruginibacter sp.]